MDTPIGFTVRPQMAVRPGTERLWEDLALAAEFPHARVSPRELAERIGLSAPAGRHTLAVSRAVYGTVMDASVDPDASRDGIQRLSEFLAVLKPSILAAALRAETDLAARRAFLRGAARLLAAPALLRVASAAMAAYERSLSPPLRDLLKKLGGNAATGGTATATDAERVFRTIVGRHLDVAPRSAATTHSPGFEDQFDATALRRTAGRATPEADRILHIALETGVTGDALWLAVSELVETNRVREILEAVKRAPDSAVATGILRRIATPAALIAVLHEEPVDFDTADLLIKVIGIAAAKPLLEEVTESRQRATRRGALERLVRLGPEIAPLVEARLKDTRWFVLRNMLHLLREAGCTIEPAHVQRFVKHVDARVRREAIQLLLRNPRVYDEALATGLRDTDKHILRAALQQAREKLPESAVPVLAQRVKEVDFPPEYRVPALQLLGRSGSTLALEALLHFAQAGNTLLGKPRLANKSPELLAALGSLGRAWRNERRARALLEAAARSRDAQILAALRGTGEGA
jgi:hypothetical protein